jgi:hypothetical protein
MPGGRNWQPYARRVPTAIHWAATMLHRFRWERHAVRERAEAVRALASEYGFVPRLAFGKLLRGWELAEAYGKGGRADVEWRGMGWR